MNTCHFYKACVCVCVCQSVRHHYNLWEECMCRDQWSEALVERGREILRATHGHECHAFLLIKNYFLTVHLLSAHFFIHFHMKTDHRIILISCPSPFFFVANMYWKDNPCANMCWKDNPCAYFLHFMFF